MIESKHKFLFALLKGLALGYILISFTGFVSVADASTGAPAVEPDGQATDEMLVGEPEAVAIADFWYAMELNRIGPKIGQAELGERFDRLDERKVYYLDADNNLLDVPPIGARTQAYIIAYAPAGYVVVMGSDRFVPVLAFSAETEFRWEQHELNFLRHFVEEEVSKRWRYLDDLAASGVDVEVNAYWVELRSMLAATQNLERAAFPSAPDAILVEWETAAWGQMAFYNDVVVANNGGLTGIPTGCTATAMAIKMRFHQWPGTGSGSHAYTDNEGAVQFSHSVNFSSQTYNYNLMPTASLTQTTLAVANLMYHAGVAVEMNYEVGGSGAWPTTGSMNNFFSYKGTTELTSGHENPVRDSVLGGLPTIISSTGHTMLVDGYRDTIYPYFHINAGWDGGSDGWYHFGSIPGSDPTIDRSYPYSMPSNYFYVDLGWSGSENGNLQTPYNTLAEGLSHTPANGHLWLKTGTYSGAMSLTDAMTIHSYTGVASLGE